MKRWLDRAISLAQWSPLSVHLSQVLMASFGSLSPFFGKKFILSICTLAVSHIYTRVHREADTSVTIFVLKRRGKICITYKLAEQRSPWWGAWKKCPHTPDYTEQPRPNPLIPEWNNLLYTIQIRFRNAPEVILCTQAKSDCQLPSLIRAQNTLTTGQISLHQWFSFAALPGILD